MSLPWSNLLRDNKGHYTNAEYDFLLFMDEVYRLILMHEQIHRK